jgi:enoyl-CoA hydratase/carnithine racemase
MSEASSTPPRVLLELGEITRLTLNRPAQANALDWRMGEELEAAVALISSHREVRVVVLSGAGKHFCSGGDFAFIEQNTGLGGEAVAARMLRFYQMFLAVLELPVPTIALVQGSAIGAGLCLALACDVRIGSASALLGANFLRVGLHPGMGATALLPHVVGAARAAELLLTCEILSGERAAQIGLLGAATTAEGLAAAGDLAARNLASVAPLAARQSVETMRAPLRSALATALPREAACQAEDFGTEDVKRAVDAFKNKQTPVFVGR